MDFQNVSTYKQSGNVIFEASTTDVEEIKSAIETKLRSMLGYEVPVFIRTIPQLKRIIDLDPFKDQEKEGESFLVTFLPACSCKVAIWVPDNDSKVDGAGHLC